MKKRTFTINCVNDNDCCKELQHILACFINTAFPPNGSECAQATRSSLEELSHKIAANKPNCEINTRQRPLLKTAINWYFEEVTHNDSQHHALLNLISKKKKTG